MRITVIELRQDSGGPGKFRGGLGLIREYEFIDHSLTVYIGETGVKLGHRAFSEVNQVYHSVQF